MHLYANDPSFFGNNQTAVVEEIMPYFAKMGRYLMEKGAEWNYVIGVPLNFVETYAPAAISSPVALKACVGWNYLDGIYALALGATQLLDEDDYRQKRNKIKGVVNIISGVQLFLLSYNPPLAAAVHLTGGAALAGTSFALAMAADLVSAAIDCYSAWEEHELEGWLEQRTQEINYNLTRIEKLNKQLHEEDITEEQSKKLLAKRQELEDKNSSIKKDMVLRLRVHAAEKPTQIRDFMRNHDELDLDDGGSLTRVICGFEKVSDSEKARDQEIQTELDKNYRAARINLAIKTLSFIGMALLALAPFITPIPHIFFIGMYVTLAVAATYFFKNSGQAAMAGYEHVHPPQEGGAAPEDVPEEGPSL